MPKTKLQEVVFTILMVFVMVYAMICYNILIIPELSEPPVRTLGATIPENESHIFR